MHLSQCLLLLYISFCWMVFWALEKSKVTQSPPTWGVWGYQSCSILYFTKKFWMSSMHRQKHYCEGFFSRKLWSLVLNSFSVVSILVIAMLSLLWRLGWPCLFQDHNHRLLSYCSYDVFMNYWPVSTFQHHGTHHNGFLSGHSWKFL